MPPVFTIAEISSGSKALGVETATTVIFYIIKHLSSLVWDFDVFFCCCQGNILLNTKKVATLSFSYFKLNSVMVI